MKTNLFCLIFLAVLLNTCSLPADYDTRLEFRSAAFFPSSKLFRDIYEEVGANYQLQAATKVWECVEFWSNFDWFSKHGRSVGCHDSTRVNIANISLGLNFVYPLDCYYSLYIGCGPNVSTVWLKNKSRCERERLTRTTLGGIFKTGLYITLTDCLFLDLFVDYLYQPTNFHTHVNIGGFKSGLGIGFIF